MSKLSLHISNWLDPDDTFDFIAKAQPAVIKVFGVGGLDDVKISEAKRRSPNSLIVARHYFESQPLERLDELFPGDKIANYDANADAQNAFAQMQPELVKFGGLVDAWEGYNEVPIDNDQPLSERNRQKARCYSAFTVALAKRIHHAGYKYAAYSFSTGNPVHVELWDELLDGLRASDYLALHEYIAPDENWQNFYTGMCNRYRAIYTRVPREAQRPILITECGADYFGQQGFHGKLSNDAYLSLLKTYDSNLMQDPYVVGATIYCYGIDSQQWKTYDIGGNFSRMLADYVAATPTPHIIATEPGGTPQPTQPSTQPTGTTPSGVQPTHPSTPASVPGSAIEYIIQRGDTLTAIARRFGTTVAALVAANRIANPSLIRVGQKISIPAAARGMVAFAAQPAVPRKTKRAAKSKPSTRARKKSAPAKKNQPARTRKKSARAK